MREQMLEGFGNVVIVTTDGKRLTSPHLRYMQAHERGVERHRVHARRAGRQRSAASASGPTRSSRACQCCKRRAGARQLHAARRNDAGARGRSPLRCCSSAARAGAQIGTPAPSGRCALDLTLRSTAALAIKLPSGQRNFYVGGNVVARCPAQRLVLQVGQPRVLRRRGPLVLHRPRRLHRAAAHAQVRLPHLLPARGAHPRRPATSTRSCRAARPQGPAARVLPRDSRASARAARDGRSAARRSRIVADGRAGRPQPPVTVTGNNVWMRRRQRRRVVGAGGRRPPRAHRLRRFAVSRRRHGPASLDAEPAHDAARKGRPFTLVGQTIDLFSQRAQARARARARAKRRRRARTSTSSPTRSTCASRTTR